MTLLVAALPLSVRAAQLRDALDARVVAAPEDGAAVTVWAAPWTRTAALPVAGTGVQVMDLQGALEACPLPGVQAAWCARVAAACRGASLVLVGSPAEQGFWSVLLERAGAEAPIVVVPYACADPGRAGSGLAVAGRWLADPALRPMLDAARAWAAAEGIPLARVGAQDPLGALEGAALLPGDGAPSMLLDLRADTPAERAATPCWVEDALAAGVPVLTTVDGARGQAIEAAGAGCVLSSGFVPPPEGAAEAARGMAQAPGPAAAALRAAIARAERRDGATRAAWGRAEAPTLGPGFRVLAISDEAQTLAAVRVQLPLEALRRRGVIDGYAVLHKGALQDTHPGSQAGFDAIWVHRNADPAVRLLLELLRRPFAYDIDDNLLSSPGYRAPFHPVAVQTTREMLRRASVVSCATARLARLMGARLGNGLAPRLVVTPNLAEGAPAVREAGPPRAVVWASSDRPALAGSAAAVVRAVRDHCLAHGVKLVCIGAAPPEGLLAPGLVVETSGVLPHAEYRARLRALSPAVLVCPLETAGDADTQDFVDGKSDIKLVEALSDGLVGVFSRAAPFLDSGLPGAILADNTYESWVAGLEAARAACIAPGPPAVWPDARDAGGFGLAPWAAALGQVRLEVPVTREELDRAQAAVAAQRERPISPEAFDEADYLANYHDVREAVAAGVLPSGYAHYAGPGRAERRHARKRGTPEALGEAWWATMLHEIGRLEAAAEAREAALAGFERRLELRRALAARAAVR